MRRIERVAEAIRNAVSRAIVEEMKDPRLGFITVTRVKPSPDMRQANVYVSIMGDEKTRQLTLVGLKHARGFLQQSVADNSGMKYTPRLKFYEDESVKGSVSMSRLIDEARRDDDAARAAQEDEPVEDSTLTLSDKQESNPDLAELED